LNHARDPAWFKTGPFQVALRTLSEATRAG
jgi:hypothetical protein